MSARRPKRARRKEKAARQRRTLVARLNRHYEHSWGAWLWTQDADHPQRLMAQPLWRVRGWLRNKTHVDRWWAQRWLVAPAVRTRMFIDGIFKRVVL